jgi:hypothetical protein
MRTGNRYLALAFALFAVSVLVLGSPGSAATTGGGVLRGVNLGFNAKGTVDTPEQIALVDATFATVDSAVVEAWTIRITGGTRSQTDYPSSWSDAQINGWIALQQKYGFRFVYVVNGNDTPASQAAFIQKWINAGADFAFIEMMNEYYLNKFRIGDTTFDEVTRRVTATDYVDEILPAFLPVLKPLGLPFFVILAPAKSGAAVEWNGTVINALNTRFAQERFGVTIHLYVPKGTSIDYQQIDQLRTVLPANTPIAVTEAGAQNYVDADEFAAASQAHLLAIAERLKPGDYLMEQILYKGIETGLEGSIDPNGITAKGRAVLDLYSAPRIDPRSPASAMFNTTPYVRVPAVPAVPGEGTIPGSSRQAATQAR